MQNFSQNSEQEVILNYFGDKVGTLLSIGENDGVTLSNSRALILNGWSADLVEPAPIPLMKLKELYIHNKDVNIIDAAICDYTGIMSFWSSGTHLGKDDTDLVSTLSLADKQKWESTTTWKEITINTYSWADYMKLKGYPHYDFISIDAEGYDLKILQQMDLLDLECSMLCIEHNGTILNEVTEICNKFGMKQLLLNNENVIFAI
jgi:FkbM family methyltransferase